MSSHHDEDTNNSGFSVSGDAIGSGAFTLSMWCYFDQPSDNCDIFYFSDVSIARRAVYMPGGTTDRIEFYGNAANKTNTLTSQGLNWAANEWVHFIVGINGTGNSVDIYINGTKLTWSTYTSAISNGYTTLNIGSKYDGNTSQLFRGEMAHIATYTAKITDADAAMLGAGVSPLVVRPEVLSGYWPQNTSEFRESVVGSLTLADKVGTVTEGTNAPPIIRPSGQILQFPPPAPPATGYVLYENYYRQLMAGNY